MFWAATPPARLNLPAATRSPFGIVVSARTPGVWGRVLVFRRPDPSGDHDVPSQRATPLAGTPPAASIWPPMTTSPFGSVVSDSPPDTPAPIADQFVPFQRATP